MSRWRDQGSSCEAFLHHDLLAQFRFLAAKGLSAPERLGGFWSVYRVFWVNPRGPSFQRSSGPYSRLISCTASDDKKSTHHTKIRRERAF